MLLHICSKILEIALTVQSFGGVMVLVLCILSDEALYLFQVS